MSEWVFLLSISIVYVSSSGEETSILGDTTVSLTCIVLGVCLDHSVNLHNRFVRDVL